MQQLPFVWNHPYLCNMKNLVHWKHWQVWLLVIGLPLGFWLLDYALSFSVFLDDGYSSGNRMLGSALLAFYNFISFLLLYALWTYTMGKSLFSRVIDKSGLHRSLFGFVVIMPAIYAIAILVLISMNYEDYTEQYSKLIFRFFETVQLLCIFSFFYCNFFIAKALVSNELGRQADVSDYLSVFFYLILFPIGIWLVQPRINTVFVRPQSIGDAQLIDSDL